MPGSEPSGAQITGDGTFDVLSDNGYGTQANSADFLLRIHRLAPAFGRHTVDVVGGINLTDPRGLVTWPLVRPDRVLTGADFDVESIVRAGATANARSSSKGFEGLAASPDGRYLYGLLEGSVTGDTAGQLRLNQFDLRTKQFTGNHYLYPLGSADLAIGDAIAVDQNRFLVIERDGGQGATAVVKRIYIADKRDRNHDGLMDKTLLVDLMNIANPPRLGGFGTTFTFPFTTIERPHPRPGRRQRIHHHHPPRLAAP